MIDDPQDTIEIDDVDDVEADDVPLTWDEEQHEPADLDEVSSDDSLSSSQDPSVGSDSEQTSPTAVRLASRHVADVLTEQFFGRYGVPCTKLGWSVYPQSREGRRGPVFIQDFEIKWSEFQDTAPPVDLVQKWAERTLAENVAAITGRASGNVFALDIDVMDPVLSRAIEDLAYQVMGRTPFKRIGKRPKTMLLYRSETADGLPPFRRFVLTEEDGVTPSENAIEILGHGRSITIFGRHHETAQEFEWPSGRSPISASPMHVPVADPDALEEFIERVQDLRAIHRNGAFGGQDIEQFIETGEVKLPKLRSIDGASAWTEDNSGLVIDGREAFLFHLCTSIARANPGKCSTPEGILSLVRLASGEFKQRIKADGKWPDAKIFQSAGEKIKRTARRIVSGEIAPIRVRRAFDEIVSTGTKQWGGEEHADPAAAVQEGMEPPEEQEQSSIYIKANARRLSRRTRDSMLEFVCPPETGATRKSARAGLDFDIFPKSKAQTKRDRETREIQPDRTEIAAKISQELDAAIAGFLDHVFDRGDAPAKVFLVKAPTGAGKTSRTMEALAQDPRLKAVHEPSEEQSEEDAPGPILFLLPTYNNIDELRSRADSLNLDPKMSDSELEGYARERNMIREDDLESVLAGLRRNAKNAGLKTMVYRGKKAAGCRVADKLDVLMEANISTAGLCKATKRQPDGSYEEAYCQHYSDCEAITQRKMIRESHVVFAPHAFFSMQIPEELQNVRAVIADESTFHLFVHTAVFQKKTLSTPRRPPRLTKKEKQAGYSPEDLLFEREQVAKQAVEALMKGECPATRLKAYTSTSGDKTLTGAEMVRSAIRVCSSAIASDQTIDPDMSLHELRVLCAKPTGTEVGEELRFWKIVEDRIAAMTGNPVVMGLTGNDAEHPLSGVTAMGDRDYRIQFVMDDDDDRAAAARTERVRISWRTEPNWSDKPTMLLDASAHMRIVDKIFRGEGRDIVEINLDAPLNVKTIAVIDRTYSNFSVTAKGGTMLDRNGAAKLKAKLQSAISAASAVFGFGRVVAGASVLVRRAINSSWPGPTNIDWCHYGAMRGLDFAKNHVGAISIGRMEVPVRSIDGLVAALTYDDEVPELPFDVKGDGTGPDGEPLRLKGIPRKLEMRDGTDLLVAVPSYEGEWAKILQVQYREEELRQFVGRLRPVYRSGEAPVWIAISRVIPEGIIVDDVVGLKDVISPNKGKQLEAYEAIRVCEGVVHPELFQALMPHLKSKAANWSAQLEKMGLDCRTGKGNYKNRLSWGFTPVRIRRGAEADWCFVRSEIADPASLIRRVFKGKLGEQVSIVSIGDVIRPKMKGTSRPLDWVEQDIGSERDRKLGEATAREEVYRRLMERIPPEGFRVSYTDKGEVDLPMSVQMPIAGADTMVSLTMEDEVALIGTNRMFESLSRAAAKRAEDRRLMAEASRPRFEVEALADYADGPGTF